MAKHNTLTRSFMEIIASVTLITTILTLPAPSIQTSLVNRKISGEMPEFGDVIYDFKISPDSQWVFFKANKTSQNTFDLYRTPMQGGGSPLLLGEQVPNYPYTGFDLSPDGSRVVYISQDSPGVSQLYRVMADGSNPIRLDSVNPDENDFMINPDGRWVLYTGVELVEKALYSVLIDGGTPALLTSYAGNGDITYRPTPDGTRVVFLGYTPHMAYNSLGSVLIQGGDVAPLNSPSVEYDWVMDFQISADSSTVVFTGTGGGENFEQLFSVPVEGGVPPTKISADLVDSGRVSSFQISLDGSRAVYLADQEVDERFELYSVAVSGGAVTRLNGDLVPGGDVVSFSISPDSSRVVYNADQEVDGSFTLYSVPIDGSEPATALSDPLIDGGRGSTELYSISPNGEQVVYFANLIGDSWCDLFVAPVAGGGLISLVNKEAWGGCLGEMVVSPDSQRVTFSTGVGLYRVNLDGQGLMKLNGDLIAGGWINNFLVAPDSWHTVYLADQDTLQMLELYVTFEANNVYLPLLPH